MGTILSFAMYRDEADTILSNDPVLSKFLDYKFVSLTLLEVSGVGDVSLDGYYHRRTEAEGPPANWGMDRYKDNWGHIFYNGTPAALRQQLNANWRRESKGYWYENEWDHLIYWDLRRAQWFLGDIDIDYYHAPGALFNRGIPPAGGWAKYRADEHLGAPTVRIPTVRISE